MSTPSLFGSAALLRTALLCGALTACGGGDAPPHMDPPAAPPVVAPPAPAPAPELAPLAYLLQTDKVKVCQIDSGDLLINCADVDGSPEFHDMTAMAVVGSHAYIANYPGVGSPAIIHCSIGETGALTGCAQVGPPDLSGPFGLTIHGPNLYISDSGSPLVRKCQIKLNGTLDTCTDAGVPDASGSGAEDIRFVGTTAYVLHYNERSISKCDALADGSLACTDTGVPGLIDPEGMATNGSHLYVANKGAGNVVRCVIDALGTLSDCREAGAPGSTSPSQVAIRGSNVYISNVDASVGVIRCTAGIDGLLTGCTSTAGGSIRDIALRQ